MIATTIGVSIRIWVANSNPDTSVQTSAGFFPDIGEFFMNSTNGALFVCQQGGSNQIWQATTNTSMVQSLISSNVLQSNWTQSNTSAQDYIKNKPSIPSNQIQSDWTQGNSSAIDFIKNKPLSKTQSSVTRPLNTIFQISATRDNQVVYSVDITCTSSLLGGQTGRVYLEVSPSSTFASGIQEMCRFTNANSVALAIAITVTQTNTAVLSSHLIPASYYCRLRTENATGTPTFTYQSGQEVLI